MGDRWRCVYPPVITLSLNVIAWIIKIFVLLLFSVENQSHCDFVKLRNMLIRSHMHDLKDVTCDVHYENYRAQCIQEMTRWVWTGERVKCFVNISDNCWSSQMLVSYSFAWVTYSPPYYLFLLILSKLAQDNRMESPIPILPLSTPDVETEKLIKLKDEEVWSHFMFWFLIEYVFFH